MKQKILLQLNIFGPFLQREKINSLLKTNNPDQTQRLTIQQLEWFFAVPFSNLKKEHLDRYLDITTNETHMNITPAHDEIISRIVLPLVFGKKYYCIGEFISSIAMSGLVAEMLAILLWKINEISIRKKKISENEEKGLFGKQFEKLGQERRIEILRTMYSISKDLADKFNKIRKIRNRYLHLWAYDIKQQRTDALECIYNAMQLFKIITNMGILIDKKGKQTINVNPLLLKYLNSRKSKY